MKRELAQNTIECGFLSVLKFAIYWYIWSWECSLHVFVSLFQIMFACIPEWCIYEARSYVTGTDCMVSCKPVYHHRNRRPWWHHHLPQWAEQNSSVQPGSCAGPRLHQTTGHDGLSNLPPRYASCMATEGRQSATGWSPNLEEAGGSSERSKSRPEWNQHKHWTG